MLFLKRKLLSIVLICGHYFVSCKAVIQRESCNFDPSECEDNNQTFKETNLLCRDSFICSPNKNYQFGLDNSGHLILCQNDELIWTVEGSSTLKKRRKKAKMQPDGNFIVYFSENKWNILNNSDDDDIQEVIWSSNTGGNPGAQLNVHDDGFVFIESNGQILWVSNTTPPSEGPTSSSKPTLEPSKAPSAAPTITIQPSNDPSTMPTSKPTISSIPTQTPSEHSTSRPTREMLEFKIYITGDTPYDDTQLAALNNQVPSLPQDAEALFHVGDIMRGGTTCDLTQYTSVRDALRHSHAPVFIVPGDNDANDCSSSFNVGWNRWKSTFDGFAENNWDVSQFEHLDRLEGTANFAIVYKEVLVVGIDVVGGSPHDSTEWNLRHAKNIEWVISNVGQYFGSGRADVLLLIGHARPGPFHNDFFPVLRNKLTSELGVDMNRVLYVHGDLHKPLDHTAFGFNCVQVDQGAGRWMKLIVRSRAHKVFDYSHVMMTGSRNKRAIIVYDQS